MVELVDTEEGNKEPVVVSSKMDLTDQMTDVSENILNVDPNDFMYDETSGIVRPKSLEQFDQLIEKHPSVNKLRRDDKRDGKVANLKKKVLNTLKVDEQKKRDLSCDSIKSDCSAWGNDGNSDTEIRGETRNRSDDETIEPDRKKQVRQSRQLLKPPKIVLTK